MKINSLFAALACVLVLTSCSSVRKLSALDSPVKTTMVKKPKNTQRDFLDMEVTPGGMTAQSKPDLSLAKQTQTAKPAGVSYASMDNHQAATQIETANALQLKYAVVMDVTVEMLTNIPLLQAIDRWWGTKYCLGGITDSCTDCSGFTQNIMRDVYHQNLPRTAQEQFNLAQKVELEDMKEGDLVFFNTSSGKDITHVGLYLTNNKFVHASTSGGVTISDLNDTYWQPKFRGAGRIGGQDLLGGVVRN
ncbi:MAG: C40 family peptidase [Chitinophagaceae bacterium]|nr:C40 family peptidase [Chitinophagaceae bacterium]